MNIQYLLKELYYRRRRTLTAVFSLAVGLAILITINALSMAYNEAARIPLKEIGADITVQRAGDVPENLTGPVFACSAVTIKNDEITQIQQLPGIDGFAQALLLWVFDEDRFTIMLGIEGENPVGPGTLRSEVIEGKFFEKGKNQALAEVSYARTYNIQTGDQITIAGKSYMVSGIVDASRATKIAAANIYLDINDAQKLAEESKQVQAVSPFRTKDANILFIKANPKQIDPLTHSIKNILGEKASVATPASFLKSLGSLFALSDKFSLATSIIALIVTILIVLKTMAGNLAERTNEIGVLKAVGWSNKNIVSQLTGESIIQCLMGWILGLILSFIAAWLLGFIQVNIPIPWEMSPTPHFLPGGGDPVFKTLQLPVTISWSLATFSIILSVVVGAAASALLSNHISKIKPSEVLRNE
ncbi:MAG: FtsX-like permease family protein [Deltaproteobacteria bacterium]|nr:FtsX-like permease family protein [Candidatus Desulfobacula maris]